MVLFNTVWLLAVTSVTDDKVNHQRCQPNYFNNRTCWCEEKPSVAVPITHAPLTIVLQKDKLAASRRYQSVLQITSDGGILPKTVVCTRPDQPLTDQTEWKCSCNQPFDRMTVQWEGYHSKYDTNYFLKDSFSVHVKTSTPIKKNTTAIVDWCMCGFNFCVGLIFFLGLSFLMVSLQEVFGSILGIVFGFGLLTALFDSTSDDDEDWYSGSADSSIR